MILQQTRGALSSGDQLALDLPFALTKSLTARIGPTPVFTRAQSTPTSTTYVGSNGLIQYAAANQPRFDHDPLTLVCKGLLIEDSRTNLIAQSGSFNQSTAWTPIRLTSQPIADTHVSPDGTLSAEKLIPSATVGDHRVDRAHISGLTSGTIYTISVFVKSEGYTGFGINLSSSPSTVGATFDLASGSVSGTQSGWTASIQAYSNGWYRCSATFTQSTFTRLYLYVGQTGANFSYSGDETSGILIWGAQLEAGAFASSYIPTTTTSAVRSADVCSITGTAFTSFCNQTEGTLSSKLTIIDRTSQYGLGGVILSAANRFNCSIGVSKKVAVITVQVVQSFAGSAAYFNFTTSATSEDRVVIAFKQDDFAASCNGSTALTDNLGTFSSNTFPLTQMVIGSNIGDRMFGWISEIKYYRKRLPNAKLQALSA